MQYKPLGRTGLTVSVAGLGCGGNSRLGLGRGKTEAEAIALVQAARDLGVTHFDTAEAYGTEHILGAALSRADRANVVISTKSRIMKSGTRMTAAEIIANLDASLKRLGTDCVDVFLFHGVSPSQYHWVRDELAPPLLAEKAKGKFHHLGLSETSPNDPNQIMLGQALDDPIWEVVMLGFHMLNQGAKRDIFPRTAAQGVGTLLMFVVRNIFSRPGLLTETVRALAAEGQLPSEFAKDDGPLDFLLHPGGAATLLDAAYRFARHQPGADVVLFGTSDIGHMTSNIASILAPPLPATDLDRLARVFGHLRGVGLDLPDNLQSLPTRG